MSAEQKKIQQQLESFEKTRKVAHGSIAAAAKEVSEAKKAAQSSEELEGQAAEVQSVQHASMLTVWLWLAG